MLGLPEPMQKLEAGLGLLLGLSVLAQRLLVLAVVKVPLLGALSLPQVLALGELPLVGLPRVQVFPSVLVR